MTKAMAIGVAENALTALAQMGFARKVGGVLHNVGFSRTFLTEDESMLVLEIDSSNVPHGVRLERLTQESTLHELTIRLGKKVRKLNTTGVSLVVELDQNLQRPLPERVIFDPNTRPAGEYMIPIGYGRHGHVWRSLLETSHILVGGESRSGKSTWLNAMLVALLFSRENIDIRIIDPKGIEFVHYRGLVSRPIATEPDEATETIQSIAAEMDERQRLFAAAYAKNLSQYNRRMALLGEPAMPLMIVVIDEITDLMLQTGDNFATPLIRLASKGAGLGIVLVLASQNPKYTVLDTTAKGNLSTRIAFRVATVDQSRVILGVGGAQELPRTVRGRMMARLDSGLVELQGYYLPDEWIEAITTRLRGESFSREKMAEARVARLSPLEYDIVAWALNENDGACPVNPCFDAFRDRISLDALKAKLQTWEMCGWLRDNGRGRYVTDELTEIYRRQ